MTVHPHPARDSLDLAREASRSGDYSAALENYSYFFEHALDGDSASLYGVRLSYCLDEWVRLGQNFPPALVALEERRHEAIRRLEATREPEHFHDFESISKYLDVHNKALDLFLTYHASDPALAKLVVRFVWSTLVKGGSWEICNAYLGDPNQRYTNALEKFDEAMHVSLANREFGGLEFDAQIQSWYIRDVSELILVLINSERMQEADAIHVLVAQDMAERGYPDTTHSIRSRVAL
jgi:hypothetical protein